MMEINSYPTVFNLGHRAIEELLNGYVVVQEKIDGSQFSFGIAFGGRLEFRSKKVEVFAEAPGMFSAATDYISGVKDQLNPGYVYRGEYLQKSKHNTLSYDRVPNGHVALFDIEMKGASQLYLDYEQLASEAKRLGFDAVPQYQEGDVSLQDVQTLLNNQSILGGRVEGVVVKNYSLFTTEKKVAMGKLVSEDFKEIHAGEWKKSNPGRTDIINSLIAKYGTHARWRKAIQHRRDEGLLEWAPQDIGPLIAEIGQDVLKEEREDIKNALFNHFWKDISRGLTSGFPQWYKELLVGGENE